MKIRGQRDMVIKSLPEWLPEGWAGFSAYTIILFILIGLLPSTAISPEAKVFLAGIGFLALWRYSWGAIHFFRSLIYRRAVFPRWRQMAAEGSDAFLPSKIYILMTVFRIDTTIAARSIRAAIEEARASKVPVTIIASIVEFQDETLFRTIFDSYSLPSHVTLKLSRIPGKGKRVGLAHGFKAISRDNPPDDAVVVVMDGDTILLPETLKRATPFFKIIPDLGALTTDEISELHGTEAMKEWHDIRFAQRHILMSSISLSERVMTLTGRMSIFRADIVTHPDFIAHITEDYLDHWRLGRFKFLTGDDKSSLYWVMAAGYKQIYLPDVQVLTVEDPPSENFFKASTQLMFRWFGNMLRTNERIVKLGPGRLPLFVWWAFVDQRLSMWTTLAGLVFAVMLSVKYGAVYLLYYIAWVGCVRCVMSVTLLSARDKVSWRYPFLLYYSQIYGAMIKSWVLFRLDIQSWTRQKTKLDRGLNRQQYLWNKWTSHIAHAVALIVLVCAIGLISNVMHLPHGTLRAMSLADY